jgi:hypothetical protein
MSRYERSQYFEALYSLKVGYDEASPMDRRSEISVEDAIAYAEAVMAAVAADEEEAALALENSTVAQASTTLSDPRD